MTTTPEKTSASARRFRYAPISCSCAGSERAARSQAAPDQGRGQRRMQDRQARDPVRRLRLDGDRERLLIPGRLVAEDPHRVAPELRLDLLRADGRDAHEVEAGAETIELVQERQQHHVAAVPL